MLVELKSHQTLVQLYIVDNRQIDICSRMVEGKLEGPIYFHSLHLELQIIQRDKMSNDPQFLTRKSSFVSNKTNKE